MTPAFWDTSGLVPLCLEQGSSAAARELLTRHTVVVWWATVVESRSAFERLRRMGQITAPGYTAAEFNLGRLRRGWHEIRPSEELRAEAERLLKLYSLGAADSLQLAAALVWAAGSPQSCSFISGDGQLLQAARMVGFRAESV